MKPTTLLGAIILGSTAACLMSSHAAPAPPDPEGTMAIASDYQVIERGPNSRVWQRVVVLTDIFSRNHYRTNTLTEVAAGMHKLIADRYVESREDIVIQPGGLGGAIADGAPHSAYFPSDLYDEPLSITLPAEEGVVAKTLRVQPVGLAYSDGEQSVILGRLRHGSVGQILPSGSQVLYTNLCDGANVDVLVSNRRGGIECALVVRENLPDPATLGLDPARVRLDWYYEVFGDAVPLNAPPPGGEADLDEVHFGPMMMTRGKAFIIGGDFTDSVKVPVQKTWQRGERTFLRESVKFSQVREQLASLPSRHARLSPSDFPKARKGSPFLPPIREARRSTTPLQMASADYRPAPGFCYDFDLSGTVSNFIFLASETYYLSGYTIFQGVTVLNGGAVVKVGPTSGAIFSGSISCRTSPYRPFFVTSKNDDTLGTLVPGSSGQPSPNSATFFDLAGGVLHDIRVSYAVSGIVTEGDTSLVVSNAQFVKCGAAIDAQGAQNGPAITFENVLCSELGTALKNGAFTLRASHVTVRECGLLADAIDGGAGSSMFLTNCLLVAMTNWGNVTCSTNSTARVASPAGVFATAGGGASYLAAGSPYRDLGTTNISASLRGKLAQTTTFPPTVLSNVLYSTNTLLLPQVARDEDGKPDLGYHPEVLDYLVTYIRITNSTLRIAPSTILGAYGPSYGIALKGGGKIVCEGGPLSSNLIRIVRYNVVQENGLTNSPVDSSSIIGKGWSEPGDGQFTFRFTDWSCPAQDSFHVTSHTTGPTIASFRDCNFHGGKFEYWEPSPSLTNVLFDSVNTRLDDTSVGANISPIIHNCLFYKGSLNIGHWNADTWMFRNNLFDQNSLSQDGDVSDVYNGYTANTNRLTPIISGDVITNVVYDVGPLGEFYLPNGSAFLDTGSTTNAGRVGFYHYTSLTNQVKEGTTPLNIGLHYIALDGSGLPQDADGGGVPDFIEDGNGDEVVSPGETDWTTGVLATIC